MSHPACYTISMKTIKNTKETFKEPVAPVAVVKGRPLMAATPLLF